MRSLRYLGVLAVLGLGFALAPASQANAQVSVGIGVGGYPYAAPVCSYGYYDYAPYACAPYGYYGPEWFNGGVFIGAGPWFHGPRGFHGYVNHAFDPRYGYHGAFPAHGAYHEPPDHFKSFQATHMRDEHGHEEEFHGHR